MPPIHGDRIDNPMHTAKDALPPDPCDGEPYCDEDGIEECDKCYQTFCVEHIESHACKSDDEDLDQDDGDGDAE